MKIFKKIFCKHEYKTFTNLYGDCMSVCKHCGKSIMRFNDSNMCYVLVTEDYGGNKSFLYFNSELEALNKAKKFKEENNIDYIPLFVAKVIKFF